MPTVEERLVKLEEEVRFLNKQILQVAKALRDFSKNEVARINKMIDLESGGRH